MMFFGDSDIEYWDTEKDFPEAVNCGVGGATAWEANAHAATIAKEYSPKGFVIFVSGENDFGTGGASHCVDTVFEDFKKAVEAFISSKHEPIVIYISTKPEPGTTELHAQYERYDALIKDYATTLAGEYGYAPLKFLDAYSRFKKMGNPRSLYADDDLHMSKKGYSFWVKWLKEVMAESMECHDSETPWVDSEGDDCATIVSKQWCDDADQYEADGLTAKDVCCGCGGGAQMPSAKTLWA